MNGWYYDFQLINPLTSVSLHANRKFDEGKNAWADYVNTDHEFCTKQDGTRGPGYAFEPIARSILQEDLNVSAANNWQPFGGGDLLSAAWNDYRAAAPYIPALRRGFRKLGETLKADSESADRLPVINKIEGIMGTLSTKYGEAIGLGEKRLNDQLVTQGTRFNYYSGSGVAFGGLGMKYTIFPTFDDSGNFISVMDQVKTLLPYVNGRLEMETYSNVKNEILNWESKLTSDIRNQKKSTLNEIKQKLGEIEDKLKLGDEAKDSIKTTWNSLNEKIKDVYGTAYAIADDVLRAVLDAGLLAWQKPPGGFEPFYKDIDTPLYGTLKLRVGSMYSISSLVCQDASFNFSKVMVKNPGETSIVTPLYCDVSLTLMPSTKFSNVSLEKFINGSYNRYSPNYLGEYTYQDQGDKKGGNKASGSVVDNTMEELLRTNLENKKKRLEDEYKY